MNRYYCNYDYKLKDKDGNIIGCFPRGNKPPRTVHITGQAYQRVDPPEEESDAIIMITVPSSVGGKTYYFKNIHA